MDVDLQPFMAGLREIMHSSGRFSSRHEAVDAGALLLSAWLEVQRMGRAGDLFNALDGTGPGPGAGHGAALSSRLKESLGRLVESSPAACRPSDDSLTRLRSTAELLNDDRLAAGIFDLFKRFGKTGSAILRGHDDVFNTLFSQYINDSFSDEKEFGQYMTPPGVVDFMSRLAFHFLPEPHLKSLMDGEGIVLDPACGTASLLAACAARLHEQVRKPAFHDRLFDHTLVGLDLSPRMHRLAWLHLASLYRVPGRLFQTDSLQPVQLNTFPAAESVSLVITNPPFGGRLKNDYTCALPGLKKHQHRSEVLFLERSSHWLAPAGLLVTVLPDVYLNTPPWAELRRWLQSVFTLKAVVSLPPVTFAAAGTVTKTSVVCLEKRERRPAVKQKQVFFADCQSIGYEVVRRKSQRIRQPAGQNELPYILDALEKGSSAEDLKQPVMKKQTGWYDCPPPTARLDAPYYTRLPIRLYDRLSKRQSGDVYVRDIAVLCNRRTNPARKSNEKSLYYIEISGLHGLEKDIEAAPYDISRLPSRARQTVRAGDVLVSTVRPANRNCAVVPAHLDGALCSTAIAVLQSDRLRPGVLAALLVSDLVTLQLERLATGSGYPVVRPADFLDLLLPVKEEQVDELNRLDQALEQARRQVRQNRDLFHESLNRIGQDYQA